ncbi:hypothetical protein PHYC_00350 [Phycisphaerales bacterium]|nr:hypothetical protein PHYC_00350 [Phycisphaerales bacterium]
MPLPSRIVFAFAAAALELGIPVAAAQITLYTDQSTFVADTGAAAEPPIPALGMVGRTGTVFTLNRLTFAVSQSDPAVALIFDEGSPINPGNEVYMSSVEDLDIQVDSPVLGFGFFFVEGTDVPGSCSTTCPCADAQFSVTLRLAGTTVGSFSFNAPDDTLAFFGVRSGQPFDTVVFRDQSGGCDNEYWGRFYLADSAACDPDANCDGSINGFDIEATEQAINGDFTNFCQASADINGDGAENGFDVETQEQRVNGAPC